MTIATLWNLARLRSTQFCVAHTREEPSQLDQTMSERRSMQASGRGFVLTGSDQVLASFTDGSGRLDNSLSELRRLVSDNPSQVARWGRLEPLAQRAREFMHERIAARRQRGLDAAAEAGVFLAGQRIIDDFRRVAQEMVQHERRLLDDRLERVGAFGRWTR